MKKAFRVLILIFSIFIFYSCKKDKQIPILTTSTVSAITKTTATSGGSVTSDGGESIISRGVCWSTNNTPTIADNKTLDGAGAGSFTSEITGLTAGATYFVRAYATNSSETGYGMAMSFSTLPATIPILTTANVTGITQNSATSGGNISSDGSGPITARGVCISTNHNPTISGTKTADGLGIGSFSSSIAGLISGTTYYLRAYATNGAGTGYGNEVGFTTMGTISDSEGNTYKTVSIGSQIWMIENLRTTKLYDGTFIPQITDNIEWTNLTTSGYCWYNNDVSNYKADYGALYNWFTVNTGKLCPQGWHVPTNPEWEALAAYLGPSNTLANKLRETGTVHWISPNASSTNESGFAGLPGGNRSSDGLFSLIGSRGNWWASTVMTLQPGYFQLMTNGYAFGYGNGITKPMGFSVRCIKN